MKEPRVPDAAPATRGIVLRKAAAVYDYLSPPMMLGFEGRINRRALDLLQLGPGDKVLDVGCATGRVTLTAARRLDASQGGLAVGLDASPEMISVARRKIRGRPCRFDLGVAESLPYADRTFNKAVSTLFFHHLNLDDKLAALRQVHRVLADDGLFALVDVDVPTHWFGRLCAGCGQWLFKQPELDENVRGQLPGLFEQAGFASVERKAHDLGYVTTFLLGKGRR
jgi:ubiquinone/menaquinone biosynthesis C-methylase UbiE